MINIVLAAGYATRMYPLTENFPKPLLAIGGRTILDRMLSDLDAIDGISRHIIVTNHKFAACFEEWKSKARYTKPIDIIDDGSVDNEHRIGAVKDLLLAIDLLEREASAQGKSFDDDLMVMAADNVLDFSFRSYVEAFATAGTSMIMCYREPSLQVLQRCGVVSLEEPSHRVLSMEEKPREPKSPWVVPPFYLYHSRDLPLIKGAIDNGCGYDAPGNLVHYLCGRTALHAFEMPGRRYDIGNLETYEKMKDAQI